MPPRQGDAGALHREYSHLVRIGSGRLMPRMAESL
jgi:hypothetical protein